MVTPNGAGKKKGCSREHPLFLSVEYVIHQFRLLVLLEARLPILLDLP